MKILVLFLSWDQQKTLQVKSLLSRFMSSNTNINWTFICINNKHENLPWTVENSTSLIKYYTMGGDNSFNEFSGWDKGWKESLHNLHSDFDMVLTCNDALMNSKPYEQILNLKPWQLTHAFNNNMVIGWLDTFSRVWRKDETIEMKIFGYKTSLWLCSNFCLFPTTVFKKVYPLLQFKDLNSVYVDTFNNKVFKDNSLLCDKYKQFLTDHQSKIWYKKYILNTNSFPLFVKKTSMCINEHILGARINNSAKILDLYNINNLNYNKTDTFKVQSIITKLKKIKSTHPKPRVAVYGAGKHSNWLSQLNLDFLKISALLDDNPAKCPKLWNLVAIDPYKFNCRDVDAVILSSDTFQNDMASKLRTLWDYDIPLINLYQKEKGENVIS